MAVATQSKPLEQRRAAGFPAFRFALRRQARAVRLQLVACGALLLIQWVTVRRFGLGVAQLMPLYVAGWIVPGVVAAHVAQERLSGRWQEQAFSPLRTMDLWLAAQIAPALGWLIICAILCLPFRLGGSAAFPAVSAITVHGPNGDTQITGHSGMVLAPFWMFLAGVLMSAITYAALATICAFRARHPRIAVIRTYLVLAGTAYFGLLLSLLHPVLGSAVDMPAFTYAVFAAPSALFAPQWMFGGAIYSFLSEWLRFWIMFITIGIYAALAFILSIAAYQAIRRDRRPQTR